MRERCVGAFLRPCSNQTDRILCDACYAYLDKHMSSTVNRGQPRRFSPRRHHRQKVEAG